MFKTIEFQNVAGNESTRKEGFKHLCPTVTVKRQCQGCFLMLSFCRSDCLLHSDQTYGFNVSTRFLHNYKMFVWTTCRRTMFFLCHPDCCPDCDVKANEKSFRSWQHLQLCHRTPSWWCVLLGALDDAAANHPWQHLVKTSIKRALKLGQCFLESCLSIHKDVYFPWTSHIVGYCQPAPPVSSDELW